jgi:hypothetical protein
MELRGGNMVSSKQRRPWVGVQLHFGQPFDVSTPTAPVTPEDLRAAFAKIEKVFLDAKTSKPFFGCSRQAEP